LNPVLHGGGEHSSKELFEQLIHSYSEHLHMSLRQYLTVSSEKNFISTGCCFVFISELKEESAEWHSYAAQEGELAEAAGGGELLVAPCHVKTMYRIRIHLIRIQGFYDKN
jgi:hypothetical protein